MNTIRIPKIQASAPPSDCGDPVSAKDRAAFAVNVTGFALAIGCSYAGIVATGTKTELAREGTRRSVARRSVARRS